MASAARAIPAASAAFTRLSLSPRGSYVNPGGRIVIHRMGIALAALALLVVVGLIVAAPLRRGPGVDRREDEKRAALGGGKEAKDRESRDAQLGVPRDRRRRARLPDGQAHRGGLPHDGSRPACPDDRDPARAGRPDAARRYD